MTESLISDCLFCRIVAAEIPAAIVERTATYVAFSDISPQAPQHVLVIPIRHVPAVSQLDSAAELGELVAAAARLGARFGGSDGFRMVINEGAHGGQTVHHLHVHVLAGREMRWPPG